MRELSQQIDSHVVVIDEENLTTATPIETQGAPQSTLGSVPSIACEVPNPPNLLNHFVLIISYFF